MIKKSPPAVELVIFQKSFIHFCGKKDKFAVDRYVSGLKNIKNIHYEDLVWKLKS